MVQRNGQLARRIGFVGLTMYGVGTILGAGVYALIGEAAGIAGYGLWASFLLAAAIALLSGLSYAELATILPTAGAEYHYVRFAFGSRLASFMVGWVLIISAATAAATVSLGFAGNLNSLTGFPVITVALGLIVVLSAVNFIGIRESTVMNITFTGIEALGLLFVISVGVWFGRGVPLERALEAPTAVFQAAAFIFFAYLGFEEIVNVSEETRNPTKLVPIALVVSVGVTAVLYAGVALAVLSLSDPVSLAESDAPLAMVISSSLGHWGGIAMIIVALFATANTALLTLVANSRMIFGMARDGALPSPLRSVSSKTHTPWLAVAALGALALAFVPAGGIGVIGSLASWAALIAFVLVNASAIWLRYSKPDVERPFRTPINIGRFPVLPVLGLLAAVAASVTLDFNVILLGLLIAAAGVPVFLIGGRGRPAKP